MNGNFKIIRLAGENFKRMKVFDIEPDETCQLVSGKNANGKSSLLDAIWAVAQWKQATKETPRPIRSGESRGYIEMEISDDEIRTPKYILKRTFKENEDGKITTSLTITDANGDKKSSPQTLINNMIGDLTFDPLEFAEMKEDKQCQQIAKLVESITGTSITQFDAARKTAYNERTELNKEKKRLSGVLGTMTPPTAEDPIEEVRAGDLLAELDAAKKQNSLYARTKGAVLEEKEAIKKLEEQLASTKLRLEAAQELLAETPDPIDTTDIEDKIAGIDDLNRRARNNASYRATKESLDQVETSIKRCEARMELADLEKREAIENAKLPIEGLEVTEDGVLLNEIPFVQASMAEKLKVSMAIAMASNPGLRVIRIKDASLLDEDNFRVVRDMAKEKDYQVWLEVVDSSGELGVYIEEGEVVAN
jgi:hypothetical protein